ncbi:putative multidrug resistance protein 1, 2 [Piedraia hortae CBS 480.64]|uniref:Putative multidrug resistance protein 1, 2 n=1 Tax=Piedraia hortae CBS 480.64 TaxID=1314780 RepID=A0A6A7C3P3_9PEZI|nr:putative multidrug resistance protein 1, 2 [Piedraia hortae CBS 480.64]
MSHALESEKQLRDDSSSKDVQRSKQDGEIATEKAALAASPQPVVQPMARSSTVDAPPPKEEKEEEADPFQHLPAHEAEVLKRQVDAPTSKLGYKDLYRYATRNDILIMLLSTICAIAGGAAMPLMTVVFGSLAGTFQGFFLGRTTGSAFESEIARLTLYFVYLGIGEFVTIYVATAGFLYTGEHIASKVREQYLKSLLRQNMGYFDKLGAGEITTRITSDTNLIQNGISEKVTLAITAAATFIAAYVIGYIKYWKLTLILTSTIVAIFLTMGAIGSFIVKYNKKSLAAYAQGGTVAEEVISSIRNAVAFGTQDKLAREYDKHLTEAEKPGSIAKMIQGSMFGPLMCYSYLTNALAFWLGARYMSNGEASLSDVLAIVLSIMIGAFALGNIAPSVGAFTTAVAAASKIYATIDRKSPLDPESTEGMKPDRMEGVVELRNVRHIYPSRPEVVVMENANLVVPAGKTTALVGASGSGKSTIIGLVERFYEPVGGQILIDGHDIQSLNLRWLRQNISLVSQEPTLFATTIANNIRYGLIGTDQENLAEKETQELVENAAKMANAHDFIANLPEGYQTNVGERGFLLSGGQKQRIAIARAVISNPRILLLDEATSALDTKSEGVVQQALDKAAQGRTTITIAHRLSTIKDADKIVVMSQGCIVEEGKHNELLEKRGAYYNLVMAQSLAQETETKREEPEEAQEAELEKAPTEVDEPEIGRTKTQQSASSKVLAGKEKTKNKKKYSLWTLIKFVAYFNRQELLLMLIATFFSFINGSAQPTQSIFFAKTISAMSLPPSQYGKMRKDVGFWSWMYFMLAWVQLSSTVVQGVVFAYCSERLVHRARYMSFRTIMRQDIQFFDREENSSGALTSFLSTETTHLSGISGVTLGTVLQVLSTLMVSYVLSLAIGWKLALVCIATVPVVLGCGYYRFSMLTRFQDMSKKAYEESASYACEASSAIRTVASLTREGDVWDNYHQQLVGQQKKSLKSVLHSSTLYAGSQSLMFFCIALGFWYGGTLIGSGEYSMFQFFLCFNAVIFGSQSAAIVFSFASDFSAARSAAADMKTLFDCKPEIDTWSAEGETLSQVQGNVEFRDVHFRYPTRPEQPVLCGLNFTVKAGQYVALVGASGCGKSTTIALLERFYDPLVGGIFIDGKEISRLNINNYRSHLALVSQEPTLYQGTIRENILLGADKKPEDVPEEAIIQACKDANIYDFILSLPEVKLPPPPHTSA